MSGNDDKSQAAAERIKAQALSAAKGLSRTQAERAAAAAARNVNAYGQKEEGPSRWQERKEAKRQMYLMSTEKAVILGVKPKAAQTSSSGGAYTQCQKCFQPGHWTYECKNERVYISRPSRTQQLKNPKLKKTAAPVSYQFQNPDLEKEKEERKLMKAKLKKEKSEKSKRKSKRKYHSRSDSDSSEASVFDSDSESSVTGSEYSSGSSSSYSSSDSEDKKRRPKRKQQKRRHRRETSSSASSESDSESASASDSDSDDKGSRKKSRKRSARR
uniref:CCHC-type domain-containing protein n=1 Tax=Oryza nivara TaxID=4536 RepID=A0A0E0J334_ORYNI